MPIRRYFILCLFFFSFFFCGKMYCYQTNAKSGMFARVFSGSAIKINRFMFQIHKHTIPKCHTLPFSPPNANSLLQQWRQPAPVWHSSSQSSRRATTSQQQQQQKYCSDWNIYIDRNPQQKL